MAKEIEIGFNEEKTMYYIGGHSSGLGFNTINGQPCFIAVPMLRQIQTYHCASGDFFHLNFRLTGGKIICNASMSTKHFADMIMAMSGSYRKLIFEIYIAGSRTSVRLSKSTQTEGLLQ